MKAHAKRTIRRAPGMTATFSLLLMIATLSCSEDNDLSLGKKKDLSETKSTIKPGPSSNSESQMSDYQISYQVEDKTWTYKITKSTGAKNISHFIINLNNCGTSSASINNIVSATVNGAPVKLENSEGKTGCDVASVTSNFVKFDDLPDASEYVIVFTLNALYGNFVSTTAWIKAGSSCHAYSITAPCCPM